MDPGRLSILCAALVLAGCIEKPRSCETDSDCEPGSHCEPSVSICFANSDAGPVVSETSGSRGTGSSDTTGTGLSSSSTSAANSSSSSSSANQSSSSATASSMSTGSAGASSSSTGTSGSTSTSTSNGSSATTGSSGSAGTVPQITNFGSTPPTINPGEASTLSWTVAGATSISIDQSIGPVGGTSFQVEPSESTAYTLTATNSAGSVHAQTTVTVRIVVSVSPSGPISLNSFDKYIFSSSVAGTSTQTVTWSVLEGEAGGTIDGGLYQAPLNAGTYHIMAKSTVDSTPSASVAIQVTQPISGTIDSTFGDGGWLALPFLDGGDETLDSMILLDGGDIFVGVDNYSSALAEFSKFTPDGQVLGLFYGPSEKLGIPTYMTTDGSNIFISDGTNIESRSSDGQLNLAFGTSGVATCGIRLSGLAFTPAGELAMGLPGSSKNYFGVRIFDASGNVVRDAPTSSSTPASNLKVLVPLPASGSSDDVLEIADTRVGVGSAITGVFSAVDAGPSLSASTLQASIDPSNRVVIGIPAQSSSGQAIRFTSAGAIDTSFGAGGIASAQVGTLLSSGIVATQSDGSVLIGSHGSNASWGLVRFTPAGVIDSSFGAGGGATFQPPFGDDNFSPVGILVLRDTRILVGGITKDSQAHKFAVFTRVWP